MKQLLHSILFIVFLFSTLTGRSQNMIRGKVQDKMTREPLELAVVTGLHTNRNTLTDKQGLFALRNFPADSSFSVSFIGYAPQQINIGKNNHQPLIILLEKGPVDLKQVTITSHANAVSNSRALSSLDLNMRPARSAQDLLRLVPGLFIAQQVGGGKAEQIFLRGFDADHGTDVNISVDDMPVNLVSQAHGQGWADLHFAIPETVGGYDFGKGPYYADKGDFTTAGYVNYKTLNVLDRNMVKVEAGQFNSFRELAMINLLGKKAMDRGTNAYIAGEALYTNGPFDYPQRLQRYNIFGKFNSNLGIHDQLSATISTFSSNWRASGEIPNRAIAEGYIKDRFGVIDSSQGGTTNRTTVNVKLVSSLANRFTLENQVFYSHYYFNLFTNFTFFLVDTVNGDQFNQHEEREFYGYNGKLTHENTIGNSVLTSTAGISARYDQTHPSWLAHSRDQQILNYLQLGNIRETNVNGYLNETLQTGPWLFNLGLRLDYFNFYYQNFAPSKDSASKIYDGVKNSQHEFIFCPKLNIQYTFNSNIQLYMKLGKGFHSNDARVVIANEGYKVLPAAYGTDLGINWKPLPRLYINAAVWYMFLQQEFTYGSDYGDESVEPGGKTSRAGIDFSARYQINPWLYGDLNLNFARPRDLDALKGHDYLPTAPTFTSTAGLFVRFKNGINGGLSYRYLHDRPANEDYSLTALGYFLTDLTANYTRKKYEIGVSIENLFNQKWYESQVEYASRLKSEKAPVDEVSYTAGTPLFVKLKFSIFL